jgi:predicted nucleotidyltransferase
MERTPTNESIMPNERFITLLSDPENLLAYTMATNQLNGWIQLLNNLGTDPKAIAHFQVGFELMAEQMSVSKPMIEHGVERFTANLQNNTKTDASRSKRKPKDKKSQLPRGKVDSPPPDNGRLSQEQFNNALETILRNVPGIKRNDGASYGEDNDS